MCKYQIDFLTKAKNILIVKSLFVILKSFHIRFYDDKVLYLPMINNQLENLTAKTFQLHKR